MFNSKDTLFGKKDEGIKDNKLSTLPRAPAAAASHAAVIAAAPAPATIQASTPQTSGTRLIVGPDIKLKGVEITDCDTLVVEGRVEASMDSRVIQIAEHGVYSGSVCIDIAEIHGRFEGELTAR